MNRTVLTLLMLLPLGVFAQNDWRLYPGSKPRPNTQVQMPISDSQPTGGLVSMSPQLESFISFVDSVERANHVVHGYRIQIFAASGNMSKKGAINAQEGFLRIYANTPSYTLWEYPNWVVRVGDFRTRLEALQFHLEMREMFPASFITKDKIQPARL